jgi:hypothetical protein
MATEEKQMLSKEDAALQARLRLVGNVILVVGMAGAALAYVAAAPEDEAALEDSKRYLYEMEYIGGKGNLLAAEIREWFGGLWHGRGLAHMLAFVSVAGALTCFFLARRLTERAAARNRPAGKSA